MKNLILIILFFTLSLHNNLFSQKISADVYNKDYINEDFNQVGENFNIVTTSDNYFILDKGDYLLSRNNKKTEYAIIAKNSNVSDFVLRTSIRIGPSPNKKSSLGIILKAQSNGKGAIIFEINKLGEYRLKKLSDNIYQTLSGKQRDEGWVKSKYINKVDEHNFIEIRSEKNIYDIYVNNKYITTFFVPEFTNGACGLIISPETKARVSYFYINIKGENDIGLSYLNENRINIDLDIEKLNQKIKNLKANNAKLNSLNTETRELHLVEIESLLAEKKKIATLNNTQEEKINNLTQKIKNLRLDSISIAELNQQKKQNSITIKDLRDEHFLLEINIKDLTKNKAELSQDNSKLTNEVLSLNTKLDIIKQKNNEINEISESQVEEIQKTKDNNKKLNADIILLEEKLKNTKLKNKNFSDITVAQQKEIQTSSDALKNSKNQTDNANKNIIKKNKEINKLKQEISLEKSISNDLSNNLKKSKKSAESKIEITNTQIKNLKLEIIALDTKNANLSDKLSEEKKSNVKTKTGLSRSITKKNLEIKKNNSEINELQNQIRKQQKIQSEHDELLKKLNNQILTLTNSLNSENEQKRILEKKNFDLKELFILKDFEVNGIKPSEKVDKNIKIENKIAPLKVDQKIYSVQIGVYSQKQNYNKTNAIDYVWYKATEQGTFIYYSGEFNLPQNAALHMKNIISKGYKNAFVVTLTK